MYKEFVVAGGTDYWVKIGRNHSFVTKLSGVFLDRVICPREKKDLEDLPNPLLDADQWGPPAIDPSAQQPTDVDKAQQVWQELDARWGEASIVPLQLQARLLAYGYANEKKATLSLLGNWRWHLHLWNDAERLEFCRQMDAGYQKTINANPQADKPRTSMVELYEKLHN